MFCLKVCCFSGSVDDSARTARAVYANLRGRRANRAENKRHCKSRVYMKHHPNGNLKNVIVFSALAINNGSTIGQ